MYCQQICTQIADKCNILYIHVLYIRMYVRTSLIDGSLVLEEAFYLPSNIIYLIIEEWFTNDRDWTLDMDLKMTLTMSTINPGELGVGHPRPSTNQQRHKTKIFMEMTLRSSSRPASKDHQSL